MINSPTNTAASAYLPSVSQSTNVKDSRWLTMEVCREFQRSKCSRNEFECKFAHPPPHVEVLNGRVICCYDSIKGKCQRREPPCKYLHPPQHLREQLVQNGRNNLILKNIQMQLFQQQFLQGSMLPLQLASGATSGNPLYPGAGFSLISPTPGAPAPSDGLLSISPGLSSLQPPSSSPSSCHPGNMNNNNNSTMLAISSACGVNNPVSINGLMVASSNGLTATTSSSSGLMSSLNGGITQQQQAMLLAALAQQQSKTDVLKQTPFTQTVMSSGVTKQMASRKRTLNDSMDVLTSQSFPTGLMSYAPDISTAQTVAAQQHAFLSLNPQLQMSTYPMAMKRPALADTKSGLPMFPGHPGQITLDDHSLHALMHPAYSAGQPGGGLAFHNFFAGPPSLPPVSAHPGAHFQLSHPFFHPAATPQPHAFAHPGMVPR